MMSGRIYTGLGLMSGTSLDGLDLAACSFWETEPGWKFEFLQTETVSFPASLKAEIQNLFSGSALAFAEANVRIAHFFGESCRDFLARTGLKPDFVASHGQTIFHQPGKGFTSQLGEGETLVSYLPCLLVSNFRSKDIALGGQGAPLVPFGESKLFPGVRQFLNLGGIANLTIVNQAFDVTVCNMGLNHLIATFSGREYDAGGLVAQSGQLDDQLLKKLNEQEYLMKDPPKSLGQEWFKEEILPLLTASGIPIENQLRTLTEHIAIQITGALKRHGDISSPVLVTGGGAHNQFLMERLRANGLNISDSPSSQLINYKEALIFAFLGLMVLLGRPNVLTSVTGAREAGICGSIHLPAPGQLPANFRLL